MNNLKRISLIATAVSLIGYPNPASAATFNVTVGLCHPPCGYFPFFFGPSSVTIHPGDQVMWTWASSGHSTTSGRPGMPNGIWDSEIRDQGATFTHTFNSAGTFPYYCTQHGEVGQVIVMSATPTPTPIPDPCYPNFTTAEGCDALSSLTSGAGNTALGWRSLFSDSTGSFNTGVGGGALVLNNGSSNTAVGAAALLLNTTGSNNTAVGTDTLVFNESGSSNTATGYFALMNNATGGSNTAIGSEALSANTSGSNNTAIGNLALQNSQATNDNVAIGREAGSGITTADNNIIIGHHSGVHSVFGQESDRCYIDNIHGAPVSAATAMVVMVDSDGRLGTTTADGPVPGGFLPQAIPDAANQAVVEQAVESLQATITQQQQQIDTLTVQLKEQATQIQKVNAQLGMNKPAPRVVADKP